MQHCDTQKTGRGMLLHAHKVDAPRAPAVREDHAAAEDEDGHAVALVQLLQLHLARPLSGTIPAQLQAFSVMLYMLRTSAMSKRRIFLRPWKRPPFHRPLSPMPSCPGQAGSCV